METIIDKHSKKHGKHSETAVFVRGARKRLRLTQQGLADRLGIGRYNIAKYEIGINVPPGDVVLKIIGLIGERKEAGEREGITWTM